MSGLSVRSVPNILSILRMALSPALLLLTDNIPLFVCAYIGIGLSDILDGFIARKFRAETNLGAKLDSIADAVFFITLLLVLSTWFTAVLMAYRGFIIAIIAVRLGNILITKIKFKKIIFIHTVANKLSGFLVFTMPLVLLYTKNPFYIKAVLIFLIASAANLRDF
jgi:CDP-diacylglycerol--glycerol-3-phosphate 3-phosphatidyltransferase